MIFLRPYLILIIQIFLFITIKSNVFSKDINKIYNSEKISDYFSGLISLNDNDYENSFKFLRQLEGLEENHESYSRVYLYSLINLQRINEAVKFSKKLEKREMNNFESDLLIGVYNVKNKNYKLASKYFFDLKSNRSNTPLQNYLAELLFSWSSIHEQDFIEAKKKFEKNDNKFNNINKIQKAFLNCYYDTSQTKEAFNNLLNDQVTDFSRYYFFYANYLFNQQKVNETKKIINLSLVKYPENLLLKQFKKDIQLNTKQNFKNQFNCKNLSHITSEIFYIIANALSSRSLIFESNFYLSLAIFLNSNFISFETLRAENFYLSKNLEKAKNIYLRLGSYGSVYKWYSSKQIGIILNEQDKKVKALSSVKKAYESIKSPDVYETFDYALFLKNNQKYNEGIKYYSKVLNMIDEKHDLYSRSTDGRGICYERAGDWEKAEKDFLNSLKSKPDQAYVLNYLAYSWIERNLKIDESLKMLERANNLKQNNGYIIDSLGWAYFKLKKFEDAKKYLQIAVTLMPRDPVVNDHFGDSLWMIGKKIQARYYWSNVLKFEDTEKDLKEKINQKLINGLKTQS